MAQVTVESFSEFDSIVNDVVQAANVVGEGYYEINPAVASYALVELMTHGGRLLASARVILHPRNSGGMPSRVRDWLRPHATGYFVVLERGTDGSWTPTDIDLTGDSSQPVDVCCNFKDTDAV